MTKTITSDGDEGVLLIVKQPKRPPVRQPDGRSPVHVVYGGAHLFRADTAAKLGTRALENLHEYAPNFIEFADAMNLPETGSLSRLPDAAKKLSDQISKSPDSAKERDFPAWFAWTVYNRTIKKLEREPVEDFRIDFEDGYGFRSDDEEDGDAEKAAVELARALKNRSITPFSGFRIKSLGSSTRDRAVRTLEIFLATLVNESDGDFPAEFAVTLPKVTDRKQIKELCKLIGKFEKRSGLVKKSIAVEIMIETPQAIFDKNGRVPLRDYVKAAGRRRVSAHFGAYDYTSALSIAAPFQNLRHPACDFARAVMQASLAPVGVRLADSVTTELPVTPHRGADLSAGQNAENRRAVLRGWRLHFDNVTRSMSAGFYQSWDLHPNQLPARYAAVYSFFIFNYQAQAERLKGFVEKATQAGLTGSTFDDAASAQGVLNFFRRALDCRALTAVEVTHATGLSAEQINSLVFSEMP